MSAMKRARAGPPPTAARLAVLLLLVAIACSLPAPATARNSSRTAKESSRSAVTPKGDQCTAVAGETSTDCRPGCQVCRAPTGRPNTRLWVPPKRRVCVCCAPGRVPHDINMAACKACPRGSIAPAAGSLECQRCSTGFTTPATPATVLHRTTCSVCRPGRAGPTCQKCRPGTWSAGGDAASVVCTPCPDGTSSFTGSKSERDCRPKGNVCRGPNPCRRTANSNGECTQVPGGGFECGCNAGFIWANGCQERIGCSANPCSSILNSDGNCEDTELGYDCGCKVGYAWANGKCEDADGCADNPCSGSPGVICRDLPAPQPGADVTSYIGFECVCPSGSLWDGNTCATQSGSCVQVFAGITGTAGYSGDGGSANAAVFNKPYGVSVDADGNVYIADSENRAIRKVSTTGIVTTLVKPDQIRPFQTPYHVLAAPNGDIYFTDFGDVVYFYNSTTRVVSSTSVDQVSVFFTGLAYQSSSGNISVVGAKEIYVGNSRVYSFLPDLSKYTVVAESVPAFSPRGIAFNKAGEPLIAANAASRYTGLLKKDETSETEAWVAWDFGATTVLPAGLVAYAVAVNSAGDMLISDNNPVVPKRCAVWLVNAATGKVSLAAGTTGSCGSTVDPSNPANTLIQPPGAVAFDPSGTSAYIADPSNHRVLKVDLVCGDK
ncbi:hypothetical protein OEZ85_000220 [Tetradesmus obliquus]|uniref:EGF-like domain-containing protein n=1 Tax=Tetradesmus obliquus TaxID=3088 RepID=A0ABY8UQG5_TETOB|nr:hypothetical protein OEZ85_000220 [Tetradesmus obliquus]